MVYKWRFSQGVPAEIAGNELERIEARHGKVTAAILVKESKSKQAALHSCFEWDDKKAAEKYRLRQADSIITNLVVMVDGKPETETRAYINVSTARQGEFNHATIALLSEDTKTMEINRLVGVMDGARRDLERLGNFAAECEKIGEVVSTLKKTA